MGTVEQRGGGWGVVDEDGCMVRKFDSQDEAEDWLACQQEASEMVTMEELDAFFA